MSQQTIERSALDLEDPVWYLAATLGERIASATPPVDANVDAVDLERGRRRLTRWQSELPFAGDHTRFEERLAADRLTIVEFERLLGEPAQVVRARFDGPPGWLRQLAEAFTEASDPAATLPDATEADTSRLWTVEWPLVQHAVARFRAGAQGLRPKPSLSVDVDVVARSLSDSLAALMSRLVGRTLVLELNVARLEGTLHGETPEQRFADFVAMVQRPERAVSIMREYPVLARVLAQTADQWVRANLRLLSDLHEDWDPIRMSLCPDGDPGALVRVDAGLGDRHRGGRTVCRLTFTSGHQLIYKPRSLAVDRHFQDLLSWLNDRGQNPSFRIMKLLDRGDHGWMEYVAQRECSTIGEVRRFYRRQGGYLALLYLLQAVDFHHENLIAAGEHPVLVDLEALFHPVSTELLAADAVAPGADAVSRSVLGTGLLPRRTHAGVDNEDGVEISGLGGAPGQLTPHRMPTWDAFGTDEMRLVRRRMPMSGSANRPAVNGEPADPFDYADDVVSGFADTYRLLTKHRSELLADNGPLSHFAADEVRYILRPTRTYALAHAESCHPDLLRDALNRDRFFDRLWLGERDNVRMARAVPCERIDLERLDIPIFTTRPGERHVWTSAGHVLNDFLDESVLRAVERRALELSEDDLARQRWFIRASFAALTHGEGYVGRAYHEPDETGPPASREQLLDAARRIGDRLEMLALESRDGGADWVGLVYANQRTWFLGPLGGDLYGGIWGIALFLAQLGAVSGHERYTRLAERALSRLLSGYQTELPEAPGSTSTLELGAFWQGGGAVYALTQLGALWGRPDLLDEAYRVSRVLVPRIATDREYDVISGVAGYLCVLLGLYAQTANAQLRDEALECGDHLLRHARRTPDGLAWLSGHFGPDPLAGFSHGCSGIAHALFRLAGATGEARFADAAVQAIAYERKLYSPSRRNWPDLRQMQLPAGTSTAAAAAGENFMTTWCHGAPGVGLGRVTGLEYFDDPTTRAELGIAIETTVAEGIRQNHSLCHGALGNLELLLLAADVLDDADLRGRTYRFAGGMLRGFDTEGWLCGVPGGVETPGLMNGTAGIGYELLRLAEPRQVPSILTLSPPTRASRADG